MFPKGISCSGSFLPPTLFLSTIKFAVSSSMCCYHHDVLPYNESRINIVKDYELKPWNKINPSIFMFFYVRHSITATRKLPNTGPKRRSHYPSHMFLQNVLPFSGVHKDWLRFHPFSQVKRGLLNGPVTGSSGGPNEMSTDRNLSSWPERQKHSLKERFGVDRLHVGVPWGALNNSDTQVPLSWSPMDLLWGHPWWF
jgi:hypothetical protein